jgi:beta-lactamase superfamily II metal-dependent hydrolase
LAAALQIQAADPPAAPSLKIIHFNVGNGDSTLVIERSVATAPQTLLIDGGSRSAAPKVVIPGIRQESIPSLDYAIATHHDPQHRDGLEKVVRTIPMTGKGGVYDRERAWSASAGADLRPLQPGSLLKIGASDVLCIAANGNTVHHSGSRPSDDENSQSLAFQLTLTDFKYFVAGDLTGGGRRSILSSTADIETPVARETGEVDVLRINHHGYSSSNNAAFLNALNPVVAIISADQGSPDYALSIDVLRRLLKVPRLRMIYVTGTTDLVNDLSAEEKTRVKTAQGTITVATTGAGTFQVNGTAFSLQGKQK